MAILAKLKQLLKHLRNQIRFKEGPGEPIVFVSGSEEELRRLSLWISYAYPSLFRYKQLVTLQYWAIWGNRSDWAYGAFPSEKRTEGEYMRKLSQLVLSYNRFTGTRWAFETRNRGKRLTEKAAYIAITLKLPPSQQIPTEQEQQEAIALLSEWLEERVSPEEKQEILAYLPSYEQALRDLLAWKERFPDRENT